MIITKADIRSLRPMNNYVVLKPEVDTTRFKYGSVEFFTPLSLADGKAYDPHKSQPIVCSVVSTPRRLIFGKHKVPWESIAELELSPEEKIYYHKIRREAKFSEITTVEVPIPGSMKWKTPMQLRQDDIVWVNSSALLRAEQTNMTIVCEEQLYYMVLYEDIYLKKAGKKVQMLNGWMLLEVVEDTEMWVRKAEKAGLIIPAGKKKHLADRIGIVKYIGDPVEYLFEDTYDDPAIKANDVVMLKWKVNRRLEPSAKYFSADDDFIVSRRANILAIMS